LPYALVLISIGEARALAHYLFRRRDFGAYIRTWTQYRSNRGMSRWHDWIDWIGGYPYEFATVERVTAYMASKNFTLAKVVPTSETVCNEYLFRAPPATR
jgi:2-polyprenyl-6-hydroxyphenyl methylase/3-demethylubiquinone-9 3-methyltransferase